MSAFGLHRFDILERELYNAGGVVACGGYTGVGQGYGLSVEGAIGLCTGVLLFVVLILLRIFVSVQKCCRRTKVEVWSELIEDFDHNILRRITPDDQ